jgi:hypothetical protein
MGRKYRTVATFTAQTAQVDIFEIVAPSTKALRILEIHLSQSTEVADAQEEQLLIHVKSGQTTSGSGGNTGVAAAPVSKGDSAAGSTIETHNTTKASAGTIVTHLSQAWNVRTPLDIIFTPETVIELPPSERMTVELGTTPADSITLGGYVVFEEIG